MSCVWYCLWQNLASFQFLVHCNNLLAIRNLVGRKDCTSGTRWSNKKLSKITQKVATHFFHKSYIIRNSPKCYQNIWATFVWQFVVENLLKSPNLVTLEGTENPLGKVPSTLVKCSITGDRCKIPKHMMTGFHISTNARPFEKVSPTLSRTFWFNNHTATIIFNDCKGLLLLDR